MKNSYYIELERDGNWGEVWWNWTVRTTGPGMVMKIWSGTNQYKWTARRAAKKAALKYARGYRQPGPSDPNRERFLYTP